MEYISIDKLDYQGNFGIMGSEAIVYNAGDNLFKKFNLGLSKAARLNKEEKLLYLLNHIELNEYYNKIIYMVTSYVDQMLAGYVVEKVNGLPINKVDMDYNEKIDVLQKLKNILKCFEDAGIIYSDIHFDNIYYNKEKDEIKLIDIDNIATPSLPIDLLSSIYKDYFTYGGNDFDMARIFAFNKISFMLLTGKTDYYDIQELNQNVYQKDYESFNNEATHLCHNLLNMNIYSDCDNEYLVDLLDKKVLTK